jgi:hypothetical protein
MLVSSFNLSQSFSYKPYLIYKKTVQIRDQFFQYMDPGDDGGTGIVAYSLFLYLKLAQTLPS